MVNINKKDWEELESKDIEKFLDGYDKENFFFELKSDKVSTIDFIKEVSAFANTYGGYIFLGLEDDATISGCKIWSENRIHTTMHDSISPLPQFDVKHFMIDGKTVIIVKIEEGIMPPYITNKGFIYRRISSGSYKITQSSEIDQLNRKREDQIEKIRQKIELPAISNEHIPSNLKGYVDFGFSIVFSKTPEMQKHFGFDNNFALKELKKLVSQNDSWNISKVGLSYIIRASEIKSEGKGKGKEKSVSHGIQNFIEVRCDGSIRARMLIIGDNSKDDQFDNHADIMSLSLMSSIEDCYKNILKDVIPDNFICAYKYQKLTVISQFIAKPESLLEINNEYAKDLYQNHVDQFGEPLIIEGNRIPTSDFEIIDHRYIERVFGEFNSDNLATVLFYNEYADLGYISNQSSPQ